MKRVATIVAVAAVLLALMFAEYRFIMCNLRPYYSEDGFLLIDFMGQTDAYYAEPIFAEE